MVKQPILAELEYFINGVSNLYSLPPNVLAKLAQCSLNLLENLPASREAVFEYFALLFDASVGGYVKSQDVSPVFFFNLIFVYLTYPNVLTNRLRIVTERCKCKRNRWWFDSRHPRRIGKIGYRWPTCLGSIYISLEFKDIGRTVEKV